MPRKESASQGNRRRQGVEASQKNTHRTRKKPPQPPPTRSNDSSGERALSAAALAQLNRENARNNRKVQGRKRPTKRQAEGPPPPPPPPPPPAPAPAAPPPPSPPRRRTAKHRHDAHQRVGKKYKARRVASGAAMEEGRAKRSGGDSSEDSFEKLDSHRRRRKRKSRKKLWILLGCSVVIVIIIIIVAVVVSKNKTGGGNSGLEGKDRESIPAQRRNTYLDPWSWQTTTDFNVTFTEDTVGDLPVMGLFTEWDDSARANDQVPPLKEAWGSYGKRPARGVNLGGWLTLEPFITPSLFRRDGIVDEWSLCRQLGPSAAGKTLEEHYATFVTEDTFRAMAAAGLDHVRIPFSYWAVEVYDGDPYVFRTSWRYLLRGIEWARRHGLRVNLDLHGLPGSQNGWNHSGRSGTIGWLNGTDGALNGRRSLEIHHRLSQFFAQPRYRNVVTHYGLVNEPKMTFLAVDDVVTWTRTAYETVRRNGLGALVVFGDGFMGLEKWKGLMPRDMLLDVHQYLIFNENQIDFSHRRKVQYACAGWSQQADLSMDPSRGHGPTVFAEWSQADTDCARFLTGVGWGNRWEGTYDSGDKSTSVLTPRCPARDASCSCAAANEPDASRMAATYRRFLQLFAEAQMHSFERGWGWWYWTWKTESAPLWSYEAGLRAGILPRLAYRRDFNCDTDVPDFAHDGLPETY